MPQQANAPGGWVSGLAGRTRSPYRALNLLLSRRRMRPFTARLLALLLAAIALPAQAQSPALPAHSWLFGTWIGGLYPPPVTLSAQECLAQPVVIFTRDLVLRATFTSDTYTQRRVETVRVIPTGAEFRLVEPLASTPAGNALFGDEAPAPLIGFGCETANILHVKRITETEISFPHCSDFPYPLIRCPSH
jgi:hypothetical protein